MLRLISEKGLIQSKRENLYIPQIKLLIPIENKYYNLKKENVLS